MGRFIKLLAVTCVVGLGCDVSDLPQQADSAHPQGDAAAEIPKLSIPAQQEKLALPPPPSMQEYQQQMPARRSVPTRQYGKISFVVGYAEGNQQAARLRQPMLVYFTAPWCGYCHEMAAEAFSDPTVAEMAQDFVCVVVNVDQEPDVARRFQVSGLPTLHFLSRGGVPLNSLVGKNPANVVAQTMQAALSASARRERDTTVR